MAVGGHADPSWSMRLLISSLKTKWPNVNTVTTTELAHILKPVEQSKPPGAPQAGELETTRIDTPLILDVRPSEEYDVSHIEGSFRVDPDAGDITETTELVKENNTSTVVCYCALGYRSSNYAQSLKKSLRDQDLEGKVQVYNLEGSLIQWANELRPMVDHRGTSTIFCHPYSAIWGKLLKAELRCSTPR